MLLATRRSAGAGFIGDPLHTVVYARHDEDPVIGGVNPSALRHIDEKYRRAKPSRSCRVAQGEGSPLYVNPVNMLVILTKISRRCQREALSKSCG